MTSAATPQRYGALTALVTGFLSTIRSRNGGQEMTTNRQSQKRPWVITGLLVLALLSIAMTGCRHQTASGTVNSTFVDVNGLLTAPTKVAASYATENLNLGNDSCAGIPQFLDGTLYTFSYHDDLTQWTTAWDQATGKKLWSVPTNADIYISSNATFTTDGKYLFFIRQESQGVPGQIDPFVVYLDKATGVTEQDIGLEAVGTLYTNVLSNIAVNVDQQDHTKDTMYLLCDEERRNPSLGNYSNGIEQAIGRGAEIRARDITTAGMLDFVNYPVFSPYSGASSQLLCDGGILYTSIPESPTVSLLTAIDLGTNKILWTEQFSGHAENLVKQGNMLIVPVSRDWQEQRIDVWTVGAGISTTTKLLWTHKIGVEHILNPIHFAVDHAHLYIQDSSGTLMALDLATGKEAWIQQFASYKTPITDGPDMGKLYDLYPDMMLTTTRDVLYVQDGGGLVAALDPTTGKELWSKRISQVVWGQTHTDNLFVLQPVDKGFFVIASDGKVDLWN